MTKPHENFTANFNGHSIKIIRVDGRYWFSVSNVCAALGYSNHTIARRDHIPSDCVRMLVFPQQAACYFTNLKGLMDLSLTSAKQQADALASWAEAVALGDLPYEQECQPVPSQTPILTKEQVEAIGRQVASIILARLSGSLRSL